MSVIHPFFGAVGAIGAESTESEDWQRDKSERERERGRRADQSRPGAGYSSPRCDVWIPGLNLERERKSGSGRTRMA